MADPDKIWANSQEWPKGSGRIEVYASATFDHDDPATEYRRASAHPVTVEMLVKLLERADQTIMENLPDYLFEGREPEKLIGEIRAAIAQMGDGV